MNRILIVVLALFAFAAAATAQDSPRKLVDDHPIWRHLDDRDALNRLTEGDKLLAERLRKKFVSLWVKSMKPHDLAVLLEEKLDEPIHIPLNTLNSAGISHDTSIEYMPRMLPAVFALDLYVETFSQHGDRPLGWSIRDGRITIGLADQFRAATHLIVYDVRDLLHNVQDEQRDTRVDEIIAAIQHNVDPDGWRDLGGEVGSVQNLNGNLIITNTPTNHREIHEFLMKVRQQALVHIDIQATFLQATGPLAELDLGVAALKVPHDGNAIAITSAADADAALEKWLAGPGASIHSSPRLLVNSGREASISIDSGKMITLPITGEAIADMPVRILHGAAASIVATANEAKDRIALNLSARVADVVNPGNQPQHRIAERELNLDLADGDVVFIELPTTLYRLLSVDRSTNPMTDAQMFDVVREPIEIDHDQTILLMLRATIVVPEEHENLQNID